MSGTSHNSAEKHGPGTVLRVRFEVTPEPIFPSLTKPQERKTSWQMTPKNHPETKDRLKKNNIAYCSRRWHINMQKVEANKKEKNGITNAWCLQPKV